MDKLEDRKHAASVENKGLSILRGVERSSNIELFRIIVMFLIVAHHYVVNSGLTAADGPIYADPLSWRSTFLLLLGAWGRLESTVL